MPMRAAVRACAWRCTWGIERMDTQELQRCAQAYCSHPDALAQEAVARACMPLCRRIAYRFRGRGAEESDLQQVALLACMQALSRYAPGTGVPFAAWAAQYAAGAVRNYLRDHAAAVRVPRAVYEDAAKLTARREKLTHALQREPAVSELAEALAWPVQRVLETLLSLNAQGTVSLDALDRGAEEAAFLGLEDRADLRQALALLETRDQRLIELRFFESLSQRDTAERLNMTQMQVCRAERRILSFLRERLMEA